MRERRLREMAMETVKDPGFADAMLLLYEEGMGVVRKEYRKKNWRPLRQVFHGGETGEGKHPGSDIETPGGKGFITDDLGNSIHISPARPSRWLKSPPLTMPPMNSTWLKEQNFLHILEGMS